MDSFSSPDAPQSISSGDSPAQSASHLDGTATNTLASATSSGTSEGRLSSSQPPAPTVPAACLACRGKHLKCDGLTPCSRCTSSNSECVYIASRRGYKGPRRNTAANPNKRHASSSPPSSTTGGESCPMMLGHPSVSIPATTFNPAVALPDTPSTSPYANTPAPSHMQLYRNPFSSSLDAGNMGLATTTPAQPHPVLSLAERCFNSYWHHFYAAHPCVLPQEHFVRLLKEETTNLDHLVVAMRYIGSLFVDAGPARAIYLDEALRLAYLPTTNRDGFLVQTLLLLIVALDGSCQQERARQLLSDAEQLAVEIGLNTRQFATANGRFNPVLEESWRRTWWDLFVVDGMVAGVHRMTNFLLFDVVADVALPCEEHQYLSGDIPHPMTIEEFDDRLFTGEEREFSSFAYRVAMGRILGRFMRCPPIIFPNDENLEKIESLLSNWRMHLPPTKREDLTKNCQLDEMMFQAHFMNHACSIMLHQPHSQLDSSPTRSVNSCAPHSVVPSGDAFNSHTRHTITAACEISKMVTQAVPLLSHTHFFTCVITLSSIVHLSKWALYFIQDEEDLRQQIRLNIGALNKLSDVWRAAGTASGQVKGVAQEIYRAKKAQQINPAFWVGFTQEEMISSLNADEGIMSEINNLLTQTPEVTQPPQ